MFDGSPLDSELAVRAAGAPRAPSSSLREDSVARRLVEMLVARGIDTFFGVPGGPICAVFEALRLNPRARLIESRHETHAAFAAVAYQRATGKLPVVVVTAGPGITNVVSGVASASLEGCPLLVLAGDVAWATHGGVLAQDSGPQGIFAEQLLAPITRAQLRVTNGRSALSLVSAALDAALAARNPGPALVVLPIDRSTESAPVFELPLGLPVACSAPESQLVRRVADWLAGAERPLLVLGGGTRRFAESLRELVEVLDVPFVTTPRAKGVVSEEHPCSLRNGGMAASLWARSYTRAPVDVTLVLGSDLDDTSVGPTPYTSPGGRLIHVDSNPAVFQRNLPTALGITADIGLFAAALRQELLRRGSSRGRAVELLSEIKALPPFDVPEFGEDEAVPVPPHRIIGDLEAAVPRGTRFVSDIGEHMLFCLHYLTARGPDEFHLQLNLGSMGSGIAGAIGLALAAPERPVVCICGDGGMQMAGMEILTAKKLGLPIVYAVMNDGRYNMVHHGMRDIFGEASEYATPPIDFAAWARSLDIPARTLFRGGELTARTLAVLTKRGGPVVLDCRIEPRVRVRGGGRVEALQRMSLLSR
jgi:acetolactate synthase I/II/III large subunit